MKYPVIKLFVTSTKKFRTEIRERKNKVPYEVTINGKNWKNGLGKIHEEKILTKIEYLIDCLSLEYDKAKGGCNHIIGLQWEINSKEGPAFIKTWIRKKQLEEKDNISKNEISYTLPYCPLCGLKNTLFPKKAEEEDSLSDILRAAKEREDLEKNQI